ncbi:uncharacterized protein [Heptranchias perlo]|uniref:uncharacterized protein n=1 Tax=Heptranchias perlo TaxID=212740 RepID=UPI00355A9230
MIARVYESTNPDWAPSLKLRHEKVKETSTAVSRYERQVKRKKKQLDLEAAAALLTLRNDQSIEEDGKLDQAGPGHMASQMMKIHSLTKFQQLVMTMMGLRLHLSMQDFAYCFGVSSSTVSRIFSTVINIMHVRLHFLIRWPTRDELIKTMPMVVRVNFGTKVEVIIDCFEVFIDRPSNLVACEQMWSNYKHHSTITFLIEITPQDVISFVSKAWGGRVSDKHLTENCEFLNNFLPGELILADRGFDIIGMLCTQFKVPAFTRGKNQLSLNEVIDTRIIANVRIHVERFIGNIRQKYVIMIPGMRGLSYEKRLRRNESIFSGV